MEPPLAPVLKPRVVVAGLVYFEVFLPGGMSPPPPGEEHFVPEIPIRLGGAINTASILAALGHEVTLFAPSGRGHTDDAIRAAAARIGVDVVSWPSRDDPAISLVFSARGERAFLSAYDRDAFSRAPALPDAPWVHAGGLSEARALAPQIARARAAGAKVSASACWMPEALDALRDEGRAPWDLTFMNEKEAERIGALAGDTIVTLGERGARASLGGEALAVPAVPARVVDPTGAGDAFAAGYVSGVLRGLPARDALALGARVASRQLEVIGGAATDPARYEDLR